MAHRSVVLVALVCSALAGQEIPRDNVEGSLPGLEVVPLRPFDAAAPPYVFALNPGGAELILFDQRTLGPSPIKGRRWPATPGLVSVRRRPGTDEIWLVDRVTATVAVFDLDREAVVRSIPVGAEPHGLAFGRAGDRAYVTCSAIDAVDVIDLRPGSASAYSVVRRIAIPARSPRGIAAAGDRVWVAAMLSGNNTAPKTVAGHFGHVRVAEVTAVEGALAELPDRDLFAIAAAADPAADALDEAATVRGVGTILFDLAAMPGGKELWVPNTEALNAGHVGEKSFAGGQVVRNRITRVDLASGQLSFIDLDALAPAGLSFAQPAAIAFDSLRSRVYVACYGGDALAVLDFQGNRVGAVRVSARGPWRSGPRALAISGGSLLVFNANDASVTRIALDPPLVGIRRAPRPSPLGADATPDAIRRGRGHLINAEHSASRTSSCASCHVDGHQDGILWDLSKYLDPESAADPVFPEDVKGPMVTQSLRGLRETRPYHWRGEQKDLAAFNGAFAGLLERPGGPLDPAAFADLEAYVESLVYPANPRQHPSRAHTPEELAGADLYMNDPRASCNACHALPLGTQNEHVLELNAGPARSFTITQLRGVIDKAAPATVEVGGGFGLDGVLAREGAGLLHNGSIPDMAAFLDHFFALAPFEVGAIEGFLAALDTGLAPSTARQVTLSAAPAIAEVEELLALADAGHNDVIVFGALRSPAGRPEPFAGVYRPGEGVFELAASAAGDVGLATLASLALGGEGDLTFAGVPVGSGRRFGVDRDLDGLKDGDEALSGCDPMVADSDGDGLPDGYEAAIGTDPRRAGSAPLPDAAAPAALAVEVVYVTTNTAKLRVLTSEPARVTAVIPGRPDGAAVSPSSEGFDTRHGLVVQGLASGVGNTVEITMVDPGGNAGLATVVVDARPLIFPMASRIAAMALVAAAGASEVTAIVRVGDRADAPLPDHTVHLALILEAGGGLSFLDAVLPAVTDAAGEARWTFAVPPDFGGAPRRLHATVLHVDGSASSGTAPIFPYLEGLDAVSHVALEL